MKLIFNTLSRLFRWSLWLIVFTMLALIASIISLSFSTKLPNQLWPYLSELSDNRISISRSEGSLYSGLTLYNLVYQDQDIHLTSEKTQWQWSPLNWLHGQYQLHQLELNKLHLTLLNPPTEPENQSTFELPQFYDLLQQPFGFIALIPFDFHLEHVQLSELSISRVNETIIDIQRFTGQLSWQANQLEINEINTQFTFQQQAHQAWLSARVFFKNADRFEGDLRLSYDGITELSPLIIETSWEGSLTDLKLNLNSHTPIQMQAQHHWFIDPEHLALSSDWTQVKGELLDLGYLNINPSQTQIRYQFEEDQLQLQSNLDGQFADWPASQLQIAFDLIALQQANQQITGDITLATQQHGKLASQFQIHWANPTALFDWLQPHTLTLDLKTDQLDLSAINKDWDYQLDSQLHFNLSDFLSRQAQLDIQHLAIKGLAAPFSTQGRINSQLNDKHDYQLDARFDTIQYDHFSIQAQLDAQVAKTLDGLTLHQLTLQQADNQFSLSGMLDKLNYQLEMSATLNQLGELLGDLLNPWGIDGQAKLNLQTQGLVNPDFSNIDQAWLQIQLESDQFHLNDVIFHDIQLDADIPLHQPAWGQINAQLAKVTQNEDVLTAALNFKRHSKPEGLRSELSLHHPSAHIEMATLERQPSFNQLGLDLERLRIIQPQTGIWVLNHPSRLSWNKDDQLKLNKSCLGLVSHPNSQICLDAEGQQLNWIVHQIPLLEWIAEFIPDNVKIKTQLKGQGSLNWQDSLRIQQQIQFDQLDLLITQQGYEWPVKLHDWQTTLSWQSNEARIESQARINDTGHLGVNIQLFPEQDWGNPEVDGYVRLQLNEWMLSEQLTRQFELNSTELNWQTQVMGTLKDIQHNSRALVDIDFDLPLLDLKQQNLTLQADIANDALSAFGLLAQSNNREARINLQVAPLNSQAKVDLELSTESIEILKTPFAHLFLGADIQLQLDQVGAVLRGEARVHDSYLDLDKMPLHQRTSVSTDEIIITSEGEIRHEKGLRFPLDYSIKLKLDENVRLNVREAQAYLGGELSVSQTPEMEELAAIGELLIKSGYVELDRRNRILFDPSSFSFTGNIDNPRLNVNLFRQVDRTTARLNITGTSTQPQFVFYANPPQSQARIINLLIFGRAGDLENEPNYQSQILTAFYKLGIQNNAPALNRLTRTLGVEDIYFDVQDQQVSSLLLGRALTNDIYIRYAHDLSGRQNNAVQIFYQLTPRWLLKSDNRGDRSSVDLIFQQERD